MNGPRTNSTLSHQGGFGQIPPPASSRPLESSLQSHSGVTPLPAWPDGAPGPAPTPLSAPCPRFRSLGHLDSLGWRVKRPSSRNTGGSVTTRCQPPAEDGPHVPTHYREPGCPSKSPGSLFHSQRACCPPVSLYVVGLLFSVFIRFHLGVKSRYLSFSDWLISLSIVSARSIHAGHRG